MDAFKSLAELPRALQRCCPAAAAHLVHQGGFLNNNQCCVLEIQRNLADLQMQLSNNDKLVTDWLCTLTQDLYGNCLIASQAKAQVVSQGDCLSASQRIPCCLMTSVWQHSFLSNTYVDHCSVQHAAVILAAR